MPGKKHLQRMRGEGGETKMNLSIKKFAVPKATNQKDESIGTADGLEISVVVSPAIVPYSSSSLPWLRRREIQLSSQRYLAKVPPSLG